jgi:NAD(P)-dependent dehydrogenase (short-subunit alcohol dehydrogenase family)
MTKYLDGRVAVVTGAGRGLGREHALELARRGAALVVNDLGGAADGSGSDSSPAETVAADIRAFGGRAVANTDDVADWSGAQALISQAIETFGQLDILVNNAGIVRDKTIASMTPEAWDDVIRVHLRGTAAPSHFAATHWRYRSKSSGGAVGGRLINTSSSSGIYGNFGQSNYGAAKAGIAAFTVITAKELGRYGVTVNAVAPVALTRLTEAVLPPGEVTTLLGDQTNLHPGLVSPLVAWLAGPEADEVTGRIFDVGGGKIGIAEGWRLGPVQTRSGWDAASLGPIVHSLLQEAAPNVGLDGLPAVST